MFTLLASHNRYGYARLGLAISKKRIKTAVARNYIKRVIRESFRHHQHALGNIDIIVMGQSRAVRAPRQQVRECLQQHWKNLTVRCKNSPSQ